MFDSVDEADSPAKTKAKPKAEGKTAARRGRKGTTPAR
jgi:hypothetical protein